MEWRQRWPRPWQSRLAQSSGSQGHTSHGHRGWGGATQEGHGLGGRNDDGMDNTEQRMAMV